MAKEKVKGKKEKGGKSFDWEKDLAKEASDERAREKGGGGGGLGNRLSTKARRFTFDGENLGKTIKAVIIDFAYLNTYYGKKFDEDKPNIPVCFAIDAEEDEIAPHENVKTPKADACDGCPMNEWGSGRGRAKACQQRRRLALIHEDDLEDIENANVAFLELAPTSVKHWSKFVKECSDKLNRPYYTVVVELSFDSEEDYPVVLFDIDEKISDKEVVSAIKEKREEVRDELLTPFDDTAEEDEDEDDDDKPRKGKKSKDKKAKPAKGKKSKSRKDEDEDEDEDDEDDEEDEDEDEDEDEKPKRGKGKRKSRRDEEDEEDDEDDEEDDEDDDEDDEEDDEDDEETSSRSRKSGRGGGKDGGKRRGESSRDDDESDDEDEDEDEEDEEDEEPKGKSARKGKVKSRKGSRFSKK